MAVLIDARPVGTGCAEKDKGSVVTESVAVIPRPSRLKEPAVGAAVKIKENTGGMD
jgi:hypothetical protein